MKVQNIQSQQLQKPQQTDSASQKLENIKAEREQQKKISEMNKKNSKATTVEDRVELSVKTKVRDKQKTVIADVGPNKPDDLMVQEKLKTLLKTGAFQFNDNEKSVLSEILNEEAPPATENE